MPITTYPTLKQKTPSSHTHFHLAVYHHHKYSITKQFNTTQTKYIQFA